MPTKFINLTLDLELMKRFELEDNKSGLIAKLLKEHYARSDLSIEQLKELKGLQERAQEIWRYAELKL